MKVLSFRFTAQILFTFALGVLHLSGAPCTFAAEPRFIRVTEEGKTYDQLNPKAVKFVSVMPVGKGNLPQHAGGHAALRISFHDQPSSDDLVISTGPDIPQGRPACEHRPEDPDGTLKFFSKVLGLNFPYPQIYQVQTFGYFLKDCRKDHQTVLSDAVKRTPLELVESVAKINRTLKFGGYLRTDRAEKYHKLGGFYNLVFNNCTAVTNRFVYGGYFKNKPGLGNMWPPFMDGDLRRRGDLDQAHSMGYGAPVLNPIDVGKSATKTPAN